MTGDRISVIIPVHDRAERVGEALASTLMQRSDGLDVEVILVDDGSTDGSGRVIAELAAQHESVVALHQANGGPSSARNAGVAVSTGRWITFLDSDDLMTPGRLVAQLAALRVAGRALVIGPQEVEVAPGVEPPGSMVAWMQSPKPWWYPTSMMMTRELFDEVGGFDESLRLGEDIELMVRLRRSGATTVQVEAAGTVRRIFGDNLVYEITSGPRILVDLLRRNLPPTDAIARQAATPSVHTHLEPPSDGGAIPVSC